MSESRTRWNVTKQMLQTPNLDNLGIRDGVTGIQAVCLQNRKRGAKSADL